MLALKELYSRHPDARHESAEPLMRPTKKAAAGLIVLLLVAAGIYWMLPELRRHIRLERM